MEKEKMPIGIEDFAEELLDNWGKVNLFTHPRRFGKSINMSMLRYFFENGTDKSQCKVVVEWEACPTGR